MLARFADLQFRLPVHEAFTYEIPEALGNVEPGHIVLAEIHHRTEEAVVIKVHQNAPGFAVLPIIEKLCDEPLLNADQVALGFWLAEQHLAAPGECLFKMFPAPVKRRKALKKSEPGGAPDHVLNADQKGAYDAIVTALDEPDLARVHLIHGITGSGKTEIYIHSILESLRRGRGAILLVPEIALTVQLIRRLEAVFSGHLALLHSGLSSGERFASYLSLLKGERRVAVGTRSAVFAPVVDPGVIIIDEEHDGSYREHSTPRYDARQVAHKRVLDHKSVLVLGSATPRVETRYMAGAGTIYKYHHIPGRATGASLPKVHIIEAPSSDIPISGTLVHEVEKNWKDGRQSILLLNRRGYHPYMFCPTCDRSVGCGNCSVTLTLHRDGRLVCHYCGVSKLNDNICDRCGSRTKRLGAGTQKLEEYILGLYPDIRLERLDTDAAQKRNAVRECLDRFLDGGIDLLVGTQMIAKGLDAPNVTLVGVLQADQGLNMPDFRASERTFALLTQVAGRAGRSGLAGRVYFEAVNPDNEILRLAAAQDYEAFFRREIASRKEANYPPFVRIVRLLCRGQTEPAAVKATAALATALKAHLPPTPQAEVLGPAPAAIERLHGQYRVHILIKTTVLGKTREAVKKALGTWRAPADVHLEIDFDPVDLL